MAEPANFSRLYANLQQNLPGALQQTVRPELFEAVREFCQKTNIYFNTVNVVVNASSNAYPLIVPPSSAIKRLLSLADVTNGLQPPFVPVRWPTGLVLPNTLTLYQQLQNTYTWQVQYSLYPVDPTDGNNDPVFPSWILDDYFDTLFSGVMWRMCIQKSKPWSDLNLASLHYKKYKQGRGEAFADVLKQNVFNAQAWQYPQSIAVVGRQRGV